MVVLQSTTILLMCSITAVSANFDIVPSNVTQAEGLNAVFLCRHSTSRFYDWEIDGRSESLIKLPNVTAGAKDADDGGIPIQMLTIVATEQYNVSVIVCVVPSASSTEAILTIQGRLDSVANMQINAPSSLMTGDIVSVSWDAPFTLDITDTDPDITYCVDIYSTTDWSHVFSECGINDTLYNVSLDSVSGRTCNNFNISVTPVNGAGNGSTSGDVFETLGDINIMGVDLATPECQHMGVAMATNYQVVFQVFIEGSVSTCICQIEIDGSVFNNTNGLICMSSTLMLTTTTSQLPLANFYDLTVTLSNSVGNISASMEIGTNIIESIQTGNSSNNTVKLTATFSDSTCLNSTDVFVILADTSISINRFVYSVVRGIGTESNTIEDVSSGQYSVLVYDLGSDGLLRNSPVRPIAREMVNVSGSTLDNLFLLNTTDSSVSLDIQRYNDTLNITCMYQQDSSLQGCLVIVQFLGTLEEFEQLNQNTLQRSEGNQIQVCLDREGDYLVTGYPKTSRGIINSSIAHAETISVEFIIPTAVPTVSTMTNDGMDTTPTDVSDTPAPKVKYGPGRNIIIGVVVGVIAVPLVLIIFAVVLILIIVKCGKKKFEISTVDFNHSESSNPKTDAKSIQHVHGPYTGDMYALVDKLPKSPSTSKRPPPPPPPSEDRIDTQLPPALPERHDSSTHPYESVSLEQDDQRKKSDQVEYKGIDMASLGTTADSPLTDDSLLNNGENENADFIAGPREPNRPSRRDVTESDEIKMKKCDAYDVVKRHNIQAKRKPPAAVSVCEEIVL